MDFNRMPPFISTSLNNYTFIMIEIGYYIQKRQHQLAFANMDPDCIVVVLIVIICVAISDAMLAKLFSHEIDENGRDICATDTPSEEHFAFEFILCGVLCVNKPECLQYNHNQATSSCQLFNYLHSLSQV